MKHPVGYWTKEKCLESALKHDTRYGWQKADRKAYRAAGRFGPSFFKTCTAHMKEVRKWTVKSLEEVASKNWTLYNSGGGRISAISLGIHERIKEKYGPKDRLITKEKCLESALKFETRNKWRKAKPHFVSFAIKKGFYKECVSHMKGNADWKNNPDEIFKIAKKYKTRTAWMKGSRGSFVAAKDLGIYEVAAAHMPEFSCEKMSFSIKEKNLMEEIRKIIPSAKKLSKRKIKIEGKPFIQGFDIDIYVPEVNKGIEFDGTFHHSLQGLSRGREKWPKEDLERYHQIKDSYFKSIGVEILHICEEDWDTNKQQALKKALSFLGVENE